MRPTYPEQALAAALRASTKGAGNYSIITPRSEEVIVLPERLRVERITVKLAKAK